MAPRIGLRSGKGCTNCVVDKKKGDGKWLQPVSQLTGFAAGATTLAVVGSAALPLVSLGALVWQASAHLALLGAKRIADSFRVDKPKGCSPRGGKVLDALPRVGHSDPPSEI